MKYNPSKFSMDDAWTSNPTCANMTLEIPTSNKHRTWIHVSICEGRLTSYEALLLDIIHFDFLIALIVDIIVFVEKMGCIQMCKIRQN